MTSLLMKPGSASGDGLSAAQKSVIGADSLSGHLFVFVNRKANYAKVLYWSRGGYCLWAKRLERGRFAKGVTMAPGVSVQMTDTELMMWLDGIELSRTMQRKRFVLPARPHASAITHAR